MGKFKIEDLRLNHEVLLEDGTEGRIVCMQDEFFKDWNGGVEHDFVYMTKDGEFREADVCEVKEIIKTYS